MPSKALISGAVFASELGLGKVFDFCSHRHHSIASENRERLTITRERLKKEIPIVPLLVGPV